MTVEILFAYLVCFAAWLCFIFQKRGAVRHPRLKKEYYEDFKNILNATGFFMLLTAVLSSVPVFAYILYKPALAYIDYMAAAALLPALMQIVMSASLQLMPAANYKMYAGAILVVIYAIAAIFSHGNSFLQLIAFVVLPFAGIVLTLYLFSNFKKIFI